MKLFHAPYLSQSIILAIVIYAPLMMPDFLMKSTFFIVSIISCCVKTNPASLTTTAGNSLKSGDMLNSRTHLCSAANTFCLQFANFNNSGGVFSYLVIYRPLDSGRKVWVGNRNEPIVNNSGELTLTDFGELKIVSQGIPIKVLYSPNHPINNTVATLSDNGNFMLHQLHPNGSNTLLWQSFDYPTDKLVPEMKLGINHKTGHKWSLISWTSEEKPAPGDFTLEWETQRHELIIQTRGVTIWRSGMLRNNGSFENIPNALSPRFEVVANEDEHYFTLAAPNSAEEVSFLSLLYDGALSDGTNPFIATVDRCYGFNNDSGCQIYDVPRCWQHAEAGYGYINFTDIQNVKNDTNSSLARFDCQRSCWNECDCVGYSTIYLNRTGCTFLYKQSTIILHGPSDASDNQLIFLLNGPLHPKGTSDNNSTLTDPKSKDSTQIVKKGKRKWMWIGAVIATSLITICLFILSVALRKRKIHLKEKKRESPKITILDLLASNGSACVNGLQDNINKGHKFKVFSCASIMEATNGLSSENKLGEGGFGPVYKGILPTGKEVAIKRLSKTSGQGVVEFKNELTLICGLQHMNLVQLVGCCIHEEERMLIYEFMPNKSLDFFLFDSTRRKLLDWQKRLNIIEGIAQGLLYLHKYSRMKIIHRDLKASNILLDENMIPKISDFGMARTFTQESKTNTHRIVGTYGYMSPEYAMNGVFSVKSDVYSFGVLLLEIVSGRRNNSFYNVDGPLNLIAHAWELWKEGAVLQLMDQTLIDSYVYDEVLRCIHIGILCVEEETDDRPTMSNIISMLINKTTTLSLPKRPAFCTQKKIHEAKTLYSINEITISQFDAR